MTVGFSGGGGEKQKSCRILTRRSRPPSIVMISRIRGEVEVRYVRCVSELNRGRGAVVSKAFAIIYQTTIRKRVYGLFYSPRRS